MTQVVRVSRAEMGRRTGLPDALGYAQPEKNTILLRAGLPKRVEKEVKRHEFEHIAKGEEGPFDPLSAGIIAGGSLLGGLFGSRASRDAGETAAAAQDRATEEQRRQFDLLLGMAGPAIDARDAALLEMLAMLGLASPETITRTVGGAGLAGADLANEDIPGGFPAARVPNAGLAGGTTTTTTTAPGDPMERLRATPGFQFNLDEGLRGTEASAAATTGIMSGAALKALQTRGAGIASGTFNDRMNQLLGLAGLGGQGAGQATAAAVPIGQGIAQGIGQAGLARASGIMGSGNTLGTTINDIARVLSRTNFGADAANTAPGANIDPFSLHFSGFAS